MTRLFPRVIGLAVLSALSLTAVGCASNAGGTSAAPDASVPAATFTEIYAALFPTGTSAQCNYCHDRPANVISNGKLDMGHTQADAYAALVGPASASGKCGTSPLVSAGNPDGSLLYQKLSASPPCGARMPQGADPITAQQLQMVHEWIAAGAPNN